VHWTGSHGGAAVRRRRCYVRPEDRAFVVPGARVSPADNQVGAETTARTSSWAKHV
jgi:hypothetical protein